MNALTSHATRTAVSVSGLRKTYGNKVQRSVQMERDGWILMQSVSPKEAAIWLADKLDAMRDPEFRSLYLKYDLAFDWSPDDRRLYALAARTERWFANRPGRLKNGRRAALYPTIAQLVTTWAGASSPAWDRLRAIASGRKAAIAKAHTTAQPAS